MDLTHVDACGMAAGAALGLLLWWVVAWVFIRSAVRSGTLSALRRHYHDAAGRPGAPRPAARPPPAPGGFDVIDDTDAPR